LAVGGTLINNFGWHATFLSIEPVAIILWVITIDSFIVIIKGPKQVKKKRAKADDSADTESSIALSQWWPKISGTCEYETN
jgi:hypothetical protein